MTITDKYFGRTAREYDAKRRHKGSWTTDNEAVENMFLRAAQSAPIRSVPDMPSRDKVCVARCLLTTVLSLSILLMSSRLHFIYTFRDLLPQNWLYSDLLRALRTGFALDLKTCAIVLLPAAVLGVFAMYRPTFARGFQLMHQAVAATMIVVILFLHFAQIEFFKEFDDNFNPFLFDLVSNARSVLVTAVQEYSLIPKCLFVLCAAVLLGLLHSWLLRRLGTTRIKPPGSDVDFKPNSKRPLAWKPAVLLLCFGFAIRGSVSSRPLSMRHSVVSPVKVLNKAVVNPVFAFVHSVREYMSENDRATLASKYTPAAAVAALRSLTSRSFDPNCPLDFQHPVLQHVSGGTCGQTPDHVFLLFMESYDAWPLLDRFAEMNLVPKGREIAGNGIHVKNFLPAANSSVFSYSAMISGIHETDLKHQRVLPTSLVLNMKRLGYLTRNFGGFPGTWHHYERQSLQQGFDETFSTEQILPGGETGAASVHDRTLFDFIEQRVNFERRSLNVIRTSSYHGPYEVDLAKEGCLISHFPEAIAQSCGPDAEHLKVRYGHLRYSDKVMGEFIQRMEKRFPRALFIITGDHFCRRCVTQTPGIFERSAVPLILYGKEVLKDLKLPAGAAGSHIDIPATVIELCAPPGFAYQSLGKNLLDPNAPRIAVGTDFVILKDVCYSLREPASAEMVPESDATTSEALSPEGIKEATALHQGFHGAGFYLSESLETFSQDPRIQAVGKKTADRRDFREH